MAYFWGYNDVVHVNAFDFLSVKKVPKAKSLASIDAIRDLLCTDERSVSAIEFVYTYKIVNIQCNDVWCIVQ